ncbi:hypothetical protein [Streptomyces sp. YIM S03343]
MIVVYTPTDGAPEHHDATSLKVSEASIVQRTIDMKWQEILKGLEVDDLDAMRGVVWALKKRTQPTLRFGDFDPGVGEMTTRMDMRETEAYIDSYFVLGERSGELTPDEVAEVLRSRMPEASIDPDRAHALIDAKLTGPKAEEPTEDSPQGTPDQSPSPSPTLNSAETSTSDSSPTSSNSPLPSSTT